MTVTVFVWDMFQRGVGHTAVHVHGSAGDIYISFWPAEHAPSAAWSSVGKVHFMRGDRAADGMPSWASKPLENLDESRIVNFWRGFDTRPLLDYKGGLSKNVTKTNEGARKYNILFNQCSTTVVAALLAGSDQDTRAKIQRWLLVHAGTSVDFLGIRNVQHYVPVVRLPTITPADVRELVKWVWNDW